MGMGFMSVGFQTGKYKYGDFPGGSSSVFGRTGPNGPSGMLDDMLRRNSLRNFDWGFVSYWAGQTLKSPTPASIRAQVQGALAAGTPPLIALREGGSGHIVVAYDVEQTGANPNDYFIRVYDPNRPFTSGELATDGAAHAAMENTSRVHVTPNSAWSFSHVSGGWGGSLKSVSAGLVVVPFGVFPAKPELPLEGLLSFTPAGIPNPFFGTSDGAATAAPLPVRATATGPGLVPLPILDAGADGYDLRVLRDGGPATVRLEGTRDGRYGGLFLGRGFVARLADVRTRAGEQDTLVVDRARPVASFSTRADSKPFTLGLSLAKGSRRTSVQIHGISAKGGSERLSLAGGALQFRHSGAPTTVTLTLSTAGPGVAPETATTAPIALGRGDRLAVEPVELKKLDASLRVGVRSGKRIDLRSVRLELAAHLPVRVTKVELAGRAVAITTRLPKVDADATLTVSYQLRRDGHVLQRGMTTVAGSRLRAGRHTARIPLKAAVHGRFKVQAAAVLTTTGKTPQSGIAHRTVSAHR